MKKWIKTVLILFIFILSISIISFSNSNSVYASNDAEIIMHPYYIYPNNTETPDYYANLENVKCFDVNNYFIVYSTSNTVTFINLKTKRINEIKSFTNIKYVKITKNYFFISDNTHEGNKLTIYNKNFEVVSLKNQLGTANYNQFNYDLISVNENTTSNTIYIGFSYNNIFSVYQFTNLNNKLLFKSSYVNTLENVVIKSIYVTPSCSYLISDTDNDNSEDTITKVIYTTQITSSRSCPKNNIISIAEITYENYECIAICYTNHIALVKFEGGVSIDEADDTNGGNGLPTNGGFKLDDNLYNPTDIKVFENKIHVSDQTAKAIISYTLTKSDTNKVRFVPHRIIVASRCGEIGRFNKDAKIITNNSEIFVADVNNNRIQIIHEDFIEELSNITHNENSYSNYDNIIINQNNKMFFSAQNTDTNKYVIIGCVVNETTRKYEITDVYNTFFNNGVAVDINNICGITINNSNIIYGINENFVFYFNQVSNRFEVLFENTYTSNSIIKYLNKSNNFIICSNNTLQVVNLNGTIIDSVAINGMTSMDCDNFDNIYILQNISETNKILKYTFLNNELTHNSADEIDDEKITYLSNVCVNKNSGNIFAFNNSLCCIVTLAKADFNVIINPKKIITINQTVSIYSSPVLKAENVIRSLKIYSELTSINTYPIYSDEHQFYIIKLNSGGYGYVNIDDVVTNTDSLVKNLLQSNAKIKIFDYSDNVKVYEDENTSSFVIYNLEKGHRIFVENYDKEKQLTYIRFYDSDQNELYGFVETKYIKLNGLSFMEITALIIAGITIILSVVIIIFYKRFKKNKSMK